MESELRSKVINDPIHGHITLPEYCLNVVDTPQFQRLRDLKQMGAAYFVFPGASHNRFEHSLGVSHLAGEMLLQLQSRQPELSINKEDVKLVRLAGLCHDLGHGPFSHSFEGWASKAVGNWHHEDMSQKLFQYLVDDNAIDLTSDQMRFITDLIGGKSSNQEKDKNKMFIFDIVANSRNSVDVDKFDYLARDCYNMDFKSSYDFSRLMKFSRVIGNQICFHSKEVFNVYEMFHTRYSLFKQVYTHRVNKSIEYMIDDALTLADPYLNISGRINDPETFYLLTDSLVSTIETSTTPELKPARDIIYNLRKRRLYKLTNDVLIPPEHLHIFNEITEESIVSYKHPKSPLCENDIIIHKLTLNYESNPVDNVQFFSNWTDEKSFAIPRNRVSLLIPDEFCEKYIRVYCRDPDKVLDVRHAFREYAKANSFPDYDFPGSIESRKSLSYGGDSTNSTGSF